MVPDIPDKGLMKKSRKEQEVLCALGQHDFVVPYFEYINSKLYRVYFKDPKNTGPYNWMICTGCYAIGFERTCESFRIPEDLVNNAKEKLEWISGKKK